MGKAYRKTDRNLQVYFEDEIMKSVKKIGRNLNHVYSAAERHKREDR